MYLTVGDLRNYLDIQESTTFTADAGTDLLTLASVEFMNSLSTGTEVELTTTLADLPAPLAINTVYYVHTIVDQTCALATTSALATAGTAINITDAGTGTHTITRCHNNTTLLTESIEDAQSYIESQTNRVFEATTATRHYLTDARDRWDSTVLNLDYDLLTVTTLANGDGAGDSTYTSTFAADTLTLATASVYTRLETSTPVQVYSTLNDPPAPLVQGTVYFVILTASPVIQLATTPALAIAGTAITLTDDGTGTHTIVCGGTPIANKDFWLMPRNMGPPYHQIKLKSDTGIYWDWDTDYWVSVTGTWGYSTTPPDDIRRACVVLAAYLFMQKASQVFDVTAIPAAGVISIPQGIAKTTDRIIQRYRRLI